MKAIISLFTALDTEQDVQNYLDNDPERDGLYFETSPSDTVTEYKVGYNKVVLKFADGHVEIFARRDVMGFAVDGQPVPVHGPNFKRVNVEVTPYSLDQLQEAVDREYQEALDKAKETYDAACEAAKARHDDRTASISAEWEALDKAAEEWQKNADDAAEEQNAE